MRIKNHARSPFVATSLLTGGEKNNIIKTNQRDTLISLQSGSLKAVMTIFKNTKNVPIKPTVTISSCEAKGKSMYVGVMASAEE